MILDPSVLNWTPTPHLQPSTANQQHPSRCLLSGMPRDGFRHSTPSACSPNHCTKLPGVLALGLNPSVNQQGKSYRTSLPTLQSSVMRFCVTVRCCDSYCFSYPQQHLCFRHRCDPPFVPQQSTCNSRHRIRYAVPQPTGLATASGEEQTTWQVFAIVTAQRDSSSLVCNAF